MERLLTDKWNNLQAMICVKGTNVDSEKFKFKSESERSQPHCV